MAENVRRVALDSATRNAEHREQPRGELERSKRQDEITRQVLELLSALHPGGVTALPGGARLGGAFVAWASAEATSVHSPFRRGAAGIMPAGTNKRSGLSEFPLKSGWKPVEYAQHSGAGRLTPRDAR